MRLSPNGETQGVNDATPEATFTAAAALLDRIGIAFLELREPPMDGTFGASDVPPSETISLVFSKPMNTAGLVVSSDPGLSLGMAVWSANDTVATYSAPVAPLEPGRYALTVFGADKAGNPLDGSATITFVVAEPPGRGRCLPPAQAGAAGSDAAGGTHGSRARGATSGPAGRVAHAGASAGAGRQG